MCHRVVGAGLWPALGQPVCLSPGWRAVCSSSPGRLRGPPLQFLVCLSTRRSPMRSGAGVKAGTPPGGARSAGLDTGATEALHCVAFQRGRTAEGGRGQGPIDRAWPTSGRVVGPGRGVGRARTPGAHSPAERPLDLPRSVATQRGPWGRLAPSTLARHPCSTSAPGSPMERGGSPASLRAALTGPRDVAVTGAAPDLGYPITVGPRPTAADRGCPLRTPEARRGRAWRGHAVARDPLGPQERPPTQPARAWSARRLPS